MTPMLFDNDDDWSDNSTQLFWRAGLSLWSNSCKADVYSPHNGEQNSYVRHEKWKGSRPALYRLLHSARYKCSDCNLYTNEVLLMIMYRAATISAKVKQLWFTLAVCAIFLTHLLGKQIENINFNTRARKYTLYVCVYISKNKRTFDTLLFQHGGETC